MQAVSKCELEDNQCPINITFSDNEISDDLKIVDFMEQTETGNFVITLCSSYFMRGPVRLDMRNGRLKITVSEFIDVRQNSWTQAGDWGRFTHHSYTRIHNMRIMLPENNFNILRQLIIPEKSYLKVILSKSAAA